MRGAGGRAGGTRLHGRFVTATLARPVRDRRLETPAGQPRGNLRAAMIQRENTRELLGFLENRRFKGRKAERGSPSRLCSASCSRKRAMAFRAYDGLRRWFLPARSFGKRGCAGEPKGPSV